MSHKEISAAYKGTPVNVAVPAKVAYDYDQFVEVQRSILDRLGCLACCSGFDIRWDLATRFSVDERLNVKELGF